MKNRDKLMQSNLLQTIFLDSCLCLFCVGCSGSNDGIELAPVSGQVMENGQPVSDVTLIFRPQEKTGGGRANNITNTKGQFVLVYEDGRKGVPPGKYAVTFYKLGKKMEAVRSESEAVREKAASEIAAAMADPRGSAPGMEPPKTTTVTVPPGGTTFEFKLEELETVKFEREETVPFGFRSRR